MRETNDHDREDDQQAGAESGGSAKQNPKDYIIPK